MQDLTLLVLVLVCLKSLDLMLASDSRYVVGATLVRVVGALVFVFTVVVGIIMVNQIANPRTFTP